MAALDKLQAMQVFARVVETGGITHAAESLRMPKATATTLIQKLEAALGVKLLNRTTRRVSVTPDGAAYYERCVADPRSGEESEELLSQHHSTPRGRLRVDAPTLIARSVIVPALPQFFAQYPDIDLALSSSERRADLVEEDRLRHLERRAAGVEPSSRDGWDFSTSRPARAPSYLARHGQPAHPDELAKHRCINNFSPRTGQLTDWVFTKGGARIQSTFAGHIALDDENSYIAAAEGGPGHRADSGIRAEGCDGSGGRSSSLLGDWFPEPSPLYVVYPQNRHLSSKIRVFVDWVAGLLGEHDGIQLRSTLRRS